MKTNCCLASLYTSCILLFFTACQKDLKYEELVASRPDSITLVKSIQVTNYDRNDRFLWKTWETFHYEEKDSKITIDFKDSTAQDVYNYTETFTYDDRKRMTGYQTTSKNVYYTKIDFLYRANGNLDKARLHLINGNVYENPFSYASANNNTVITMYDTSMIGGRHTAYRPAVIQYTFNPANQIIRQQEAETGPDKARNRWFRDTFDYRFSYDPTGNVETMMMDYTFLSNNVNTPHVKDSASFKRETSGGEIYETFNTVYRNMYWFSFSEFANNSFATAMAHTVFYPYYLYHFKTPVRQIDYVFSASVPAYGTLVTGTFQNSFDNQGLLTRTVYPKNFAHTYGGKAQLDFTYERVRK